MLHKFTYSLALVVHLYFWKNVHSTESSCGIHDSSRKPSLYPFRLLLLLDLQSQTRKQVSTKNRFFFRLSSVWDDNVFFLSHSPSNSLCLSILHVYHWWVVDSKYAIYTWKKVCNNLHVTAQESLLRIYICKSNVNARRDSVDLRCTEIKCFSFAFSNRYFYSRFRPEAKLSLNSKRTIGELFIREAFSVNDSSRLPYTAGSAVSSACPLPPTALWLMPNNYRYFTHSFLLCLFHAALYFSFVLSILSHFSAVKEHSKHNRLHSSTRSGIHFFNFVFFFSFPCVCCLEKNIKNNM